MMGPYGPFGGGMGGGSWVAMGFAFVVFWGLGIGGIVLLVRSFGHSHEVGKEPLGPTTALRILDDRFARGEIDTDEYSRRRQLLRPT